MQNYNLLSDVLQLGGVLRSSVDLETGEYFAAPDRGDAPTGSGQAGEDGSSLSSTHISPRSEKPFFEWYKGASILKVSRGATCEQQGGGVRGLIDGFSLGSRQRLMRTIGKVQREAELPAFVTLTYPDAFPTDPKVVKNHLDMFFKRLRRAIPLAGSIWKLEPQERGAAHFHLLVWGADFDTLRAFAPYAWYEIAGGGDEKHLMWHLGMFGGENKHCVDKVHDFDGVWMYAAKYLGKSFEVAGWSNVGRFWGVFNRGSIPWGEKVVIDVDMAKVFQTMRYQRRKMRDNKKGGRLKKKPNLRSNTNSITLLCDADQWVQKMEVNTG